MWIQKDLNKTRILVQWYWMYHIYKGICLYNCHVFHCGQSFSIYIYKQSVSKIIWKIVLKMWFDCFAKILFPTYFFYRMFPFSFFYLHIHFEWFFCSLILLYVHCSFMQRTNEMWLEKHKKKQYLLYTITCFYFTMVHIHSLTLTERFKSFSKIITNIYII